MTEGFWCKNAPPDNKKKLLSGHSTADIVIIGGGLLGMWLAYDITRLAPNKKVVLLESGACGWGPSGRNGGIVYDFWPSLHLLEKHLDTGSALRLANYSNNLIKDSLHLFSEEEIDLVEKGALHISTSPFHDQAAEAKHKALREAGRDDLFQILSKEEVAARIRSNRFRGGTFYPEVRTIHPGKLVRALRERLEKEGVLIFENTTAWKAEGGMVRTFGSSIRAEKLVLATGSVGRLSLSQKLTISSSHMIVTEPVPDVLKEINWTGGEAVTDERQTVRYMRTTADKRIAFGWGRGRIKPGLTLDSSEGEFEKIEASLRSLFPELEGKRIEDKWGGPIDISPTHLPFIMQPDRNSWAAAGFTGNGVGPTRVVARIIASRVLEKDDEAASLQLPHPPVLPPEPLRTWGGNLVRNALLNKEAAEESGKKGKPLTRFLSWLPGKIGIQIGR